MASTKVTFTLDDDTIRRLAKAARRLDKPKSQVVREAIREFSDRIGRLSEQERLRMLRVFDEVTARIPKRRAADVDREIRSVRDARRGGGRRSTREESR
jgi:flagellar motor switch protein FliG